MKAVLTDSEPLVDYIAFVTLAVILLAAGIMLTVLAEPGGYVAFLFAGVTGLLLFQFAYGLLYRRYFVPQLVARVSLVFFFLVAAAFRLDHGEDLVSLIYAAIAALVAWISYRQLAHHKSLMVNSFSVASITLASGLAAFAAAYDVGRILGAMAQTMYAQAI